MVKSKVGAEPKGKVKHSFTKDAGIHEGIHRDEPGWIIYSTSMYYNRRKS